jgi:glycosyltransferase involved in cell wall biosynthesis
MPHLSRGGAERVTHSFLQGLNPSELDIHLVVFQFENQLLGPLHPGITVHTLNSGRLLYSIVPMLYTLSLLRPNIVYSTHGYVSIPLLMFRGVYGLGTRLIIREANLPSKSLRHQKFTLIFSFFYRRLYPKVDALICLSQSMRKELHSGYGVPNHLLYLMPNPTNVKAIRNNLYPSRAPGDGIRFVAAGKLHYQKGFDRLLKWFALMPIESHLTIMGAGPQGDPLNRLAQALGVSDRVHFVGHQSNPWSFIAGADVFLLPSRWEGMPNIVLEALACGVPVIAMSEAGGVVDVALLVDENAMTVANTEMDFITAMKKVEPDKNVTLRPSLLPTCFDVSSVQPLFNKLVNKIAGVD